MEKTAKFGTKYSRMDQEKFVKDNLFKIWSDMVCLGRAWKIIKIETLALPCILWCCEDNKTPRKYQTFQSLTEPVTSCYFRHRFRVIFFPIQEQHFPS